MELSQEQLAKLEGMEHYAPKEEPASIEVEPIRQERRPGRANRGSVAKVAESELPSAEKSDQDAETGGT